MKTPAFCRHWLLAAAAVLLSGCGVSPQQVTIAPEVDLSIPSYGASRPVRIDARDARENKVIGSRGGVYKDTAQITVANDIDEALRKVANAQMAAQGFSVNSDNPDAAQITVFLEELNYDTPETSMLRDVSVTAKLRLQAKYLGQTFSSQYQTKKNRSFVTRPDAEDNQQLINDVLAQTLKRLFSDEKLHAFLQN